MNKYGIFGFCMVSFLVVFSLIRLSEFELSDDGHQRTISFEHHQDILEGTLILPSGKISPPLVLLVHGDGAQDRWSEGGYIPLVNFLVAQGVAVYSWDKPGVGASSGNWLAQTLSDRAEEAASALFDYQLSSQWPWWKQGGFLLAGQQAYSPGSLSAISAWILNQQCHE
ncbi:alpha/beta hydrolase family protein [Serratia fonticola]